MVVLSAAIAIATAYQAVVATPGFEVAQRKAEFDARYALASERAKLESLVTTECVKPAYTGACRRAKAALAAFDAHRE